jgi:hypothetical protein
LFRDGVSDRVEPGAASSGEYNSFHLGSLLLAKIKIR